MGQRLPRSVTGASDAALFAAAREGRTEAFAELYRRHAEAAWRVALAVTRNPADAADAVSEAFARLFSALSRDLRGPGAAFRPYLLATTRNAAIDIFRRNRRALPARLDDEGLAPGDAEPPDEVLLAEEAALVARAFSDLPERWRTVLWLTEVEGLPPREAAVRLGLTPNGTAQLAVRARAGLRERYLQAHLRADPPPECRLTLEHLGAYVGGGIAARDLAKVDQHLAACAACRARLAELEDVSRTLRLVAVPLPLGLASAVFSRWRHALSAAPHVPARPLLQGAQRALAAASAGLLVAGVIGAVLEGRDGSGPAVPPTRPAIVEGFTLSRPPAPASDPGPPLPPPFEAAPDALPVAVPEVPSAAPPTPTAGPAGADDHTPSPGTQPRRVTAPPAPAGPSAATPVAQIAAGISDGDDGVAVAAGVGDGTCTGAHAGPVTLGCAPAPPAAAGVEVHTDGSALPPVHVQLP